MKLRWRSAILLLYTVSLTACQTTLAPTPTPAPAPMIPPTLNISLWIDYPVVSIALFTAKKYTQYANVIVSDANGKFVAGATVRGQCVSTKGMIAVIFPVTDANGQARAPIDITSMTLTSTHTLSVTALHNADWSITAITSFDVIP